MRTWPLGLEVFRCAYDRLGCGDFTVFDFFVGWRLSFAWFLVFDNSALTFVATFAVSTLYRDAA